MTTSTTLLWLLASHLLCAVNNKINNALRVLPITPDCFCRNWKRSCGRVPKCRLRKVVVYCSTRRDGRHEHGEESFASMSREPPCLADALGPAPAEVEESVAAIAGVLSARWGDFCESHRPASAAFAVQDPKRDRGQPLDVYGLSW